MTRLQVACCRVCCCKSSARWCPLAGAICLGLRKLPAAASSCHRMLPPNNR